MKTHEWPSSTRWEVLGLCKGNRHSLQDITHITNVPKSTVEDIKQRKTGVSKPRTGRPKKVSPRTIRQLIRFIRINKATRRFSLTQLKKIFRLNVHENTIQRALNEAGYNRRIARRCVFLNKRDRARRLKFAKEHLHWTVEDWKRVLFSDEMGVKLFMERNSRDWVWRKKGEEYHPDCINYRKRPQGTGIIFWGVFRKGKMGPGTFFDLEKGEKVNSVIYRDQILLKPLKEFWEESFLDVNDPIVMEDNAPVHKGVCIQARKDLGMITLEHPPNSPDLNPIETIWADMKDIIAEDYAEVSSVQELKWIVQRLWNDYPDDKWDSLIESMPDKMKKLVAARGGSIEG
jgi:transposase